MSSIPPSPLYKYRDDSARTEQIILDGKVWLATSEQLNDPFECKTGLIPEGWKRNKIREMENAQMSGFVMSAMPSLKGKCSFYSFSHRATKRWFERLKRQKDRKEKYAMIKDFLRDHKVETSTPSDLFKKFEVQLSQVGIFSLSECPDDELMWAHYASSHTGLALGFKRIAGTKLASAEHTMQVQYNNSKPIFTSGFNNQLLMSHTNGAGIKAELKIGFSDPTFRAAFSTKTVKWTYEKEWRYVEEKGGLYSWPGPLDSVVFGLKMSEVRRKHYAAVVASAVSNPVSFFEIIIASDNASYRMVPWPAVP